MKIRYLFCAIALVAVVGCSSDEPNNTPAPAPAPTPPEKVSNLQKYAGDDEIKVMSFNVRMNSASDGSNAWPNRKDSAIELIKDHKPTVIGFQEAKYIDQWLVIKDELYEEYDGWGVDRDNGEKNPKNGEVMGILYDKATVKKIEGGTFWLSTTPDVVSKSWNSSCNRTATWGIFEHIPTGKKFCYINTHLDHKSAEAQKIGMQLIVKKFKEHNPDGYPQFLSGDLNVKIDNEALDVLDGYMDNTRVTAPKDKTDNDRTHNGFSPSGGSIIDHIYCTAGMEVVEYHTIDERYGRADYVSDHYPIYAIIKL